MTDEQNEEVDDELTGDELSLEDIIRLALKQHWDHSGTTSLTAGDLISFVRTQRAVMIFDGLDEMLHLSFDCDIALNGYSIDGGRSLFGGSEVDVGYIDRGGRFLCETLAHCATDAASRAGHNDDFV